MDLTNFNLRSSSQVRKIGKDSFEGRVFIFPVLHPQNNRLENISIS
jgi:hypothetical protein